MGTWGPQLDANDTAQDVVDEFSGQIRAMKKDPREVPALFRRVIRRYGSDSDAVLGLGWVLFKHHVSLTAVKALLLQHLKRELMDKQVQAWSGQNERKEVLLRFQSLLEGKSLSTIERAPKMHFPKRVPTRVGHRWGYRDSKGKLVIKAQFDFADEFEQGVARVRIGFKPRPVKYGLIDTAGHFVIPPRYDEMDVFFHGVAQVQLKSKIGYISQAGREIVSPMWDEGDPFEDGVARVRRGKKWGMLSPTGELLLKPEWDCLDEWSPTSVIGKKNGKKVKILLNKGSSGSELK